MSLNQEMDKHRAPHADGMLMAATLNDAGGISVDCVNGSSHLGKRKKTSELQPSHMKYHKMSTRRRETQVRGSRP